MELVPAATYLRMSTDQQDQSLENQSIAIQTYADENHFQIVRTYWDRGKSGLQLRHRSGLKKLLQDIEGGQVDYEAVLVFDVSRWGRFQDADESAYYEYSCRRASIDIHYCTEPFQGDRTPFGAVYKSIKRAMAGEYSRELSAKVFAGQTKLVKHGFFPGGKAPLGIRRLCVDEFGNGRGLLTYHQRKSYPTDRVKIVLGPRSEQRTVRKIFNLFAVEKHTEIGVTRELLEAGERPPVMANWNRSVIHRILRNEIYIGNYVYNKTTAQLGTRQRNTNPDNWVRIEGIVEAIVSQKLFDQVQQIYDSKAKFTDAEILDRLRQIQAKHSRITCELIDLEEGFLCSASVAHRFGSISEAYAAAGLKGR